MTSPALKDVLTLFRQFGLLRAKEVPLLAPVTSAQLPEAVAFDCATKTGAAEVSLVQPSGMAIQKMIQAYTINRIPCRTRCFVFAKVFISPRAALKLLMFLLIVPAAVWNLNMILYREDEWVVHDFLSIVGPASTSPHLNRFRILRRLSLNQHCLVELICSGLSDLMVLVIIFHCLAR
jgi:hypothetical protein